MPLLKSRILPLVLMVLPLLAMVAGSRTRPREKPVQQVAAPAGLWKGTSVCLQGKPVCKDEIVVYHIAVIPTKPAHFAILANKIVNGREEEMGTLDCRYDAPASSLECPMPPGLPPGTWLFRVQERMLEGELLTPDRGAFRRVHVARVD